MWLACIGQPAIQLFPWVPRNHCLTAFRVRICTACKENCFCSLGTLRVVFISPYGGAENNVTSKKKITEVLPSRRISKVLSGELNTLRFVCMCGGCGLCVWCVYMSKVCARKQRQTLDFLLYHFLSLNQKLLSQQTLDFCLPSSSLPNVGVRGMSRHIQLFMWELGIWTKFLMFAAQGLLSTEPSAQPFPLSFYTENFSLILTKFFKRASRFSAIVFSWIVIMVFDCCPSSS